MANNRAPNGHGSLVTALVVTFLSLAVLYVPLSRVAGAGGPLGCVIAMLVIWIVTYLVARLHECIVTLAGHAEHILPAEDGPQGPQHGSAQEPEPSPDAPASVEEPVPADAAEEVEAPAQEPDDLVSPEPDEEGAGQIPELERVESVDGHSVFDVDKFERTLTASADPITELKLLVEDIRTREANDGIDVLGQDRLPPSEFELFCARVLEEAGLLADDVRLPPLRALLLSRSRLFYLRIEQPAFTYAAKLRVIQIEAALNRIHLACVYFDDVSKVTMADAYLFNQQFEHVICAQIPQLVDEDNVAESGEWGTRLSLGIGLETMQTPYRLTADYRVNTRRRVAAISIDLIPSEAFAASCYSFDANRVIPTTSIMRKRAASEYNMRLAILLAAYVFRSSPSINEVYVKGVLDDARTNTCYYSVCFDRTRFSGIDLLRVDNLQWHFRCFAARFKLEDGVLQPVDATFSLEDEMFCPASRYDSVELSHRPLLGDAAEILGTHKVSGLSIDEDAHRAQVAVDISRKLTSSTAENVRTILDAASSDDDPTVQKAARRTIRKLIDGSIEDGNAYSFVHEFVEGDDLTMAVEDGWRLENNDDPTGVIRTIAPALHDIDGVGKFADGNDVEWRSFNDYVDRALYNRMLAGSKTVRLVPQSYYQAHMLMGRALLDLDRPEDALAHAERATQLNPMDASPYLLAARCNEVRGDYDSAVEDLGSLLSVAHNAEGVSRAYYRMAFMQYRLGRPEVTEACYLRCLNFISSAYPMAAIELGILRESGEVPQEMTDDQVEGILLTNGIPLAPVERISKALYDCARASLDAELFGVARSFFRTLGTFYGDDVLLDVIRSIENEPDR